MPMRYAITDNNGYTVYACETAREVATYMDRLKDAAVRRNERCGPFWLEEFDYDTWEYMTSRKLI